MAYPHSFGYNSFYRPNLPFHPPTSFSSFHHYTQPTLSSFTSYPIIWCDYYHNPSHPSEQCPSIGYPLVLGQNQFHTFQRPTSEPYPSNLKLECWNYSESTGVQSQQMLCDNIQHLSHLDMISSELAGEKEKDPFSTHPVLDSKPNRSMSIQAHINLDKMNKVQTTRSMSIQDHINLDKLNRVQTTRPISILDHINMSTHSIKST